MKHKILFLDVDGTITNHEDGSIPSSTKVAIRQLLDNGFQVVAATGRPLSMCDEIAALGIHTFITANGAYVKHKDQVIHKNVLNSETVRNFVNFAAVEQNALTFYSETIQMNAVQHPDVLKALYETLRLKKFPPEITNAVDGETYLLNLFIDENDIHKYKAQFPHITFNRWHPFIVNVLEEEVSKSVAIRKVLAYFGLNESEAVAFGDGGNDVDMLELVDLGIAMGNASDKLKSIADFVTEKSSEDGIAFALRKYGFI